VRFYWFYQTIVFYPRPTVYSGTETTPPATPLTTLQSVAYSGVSAV